MGWLGWQQTLIRARIPDGEIAPRPYMEEHIPLVLPGAAIGPTQGLNRPSQGPIYY